MGHVSWCDHFCLLFCLLSRVGLKLRYSALDFFNSILQISVLTFTFMAAGGVEMANLARVMSVRSMMQNADGPEPTTDLKEMLRTILKYA